jgi:hypothetical protein
MKRGHTEASISKTLGIKAAIIRQRMELGKLEPILYELLETGRISVSVGEAAAKLSPAMQGSLVEVFSEADKLTTKDVEAVKRVRREERTSSLSDIIFGGNEKRVTDARTALSHIDAAETLLKALGETVDFDTLRSRLGKLIS